MALSTKSRKKKKNAKIELIRCVSEGLEIGHYNSSILPDDFWKRPIVPSQNPRITLPHVNKR